MGWYGEEPPMPGYAEMPELVGWGEYPGAPEMGGYGEYAEPDYAGYVRDVPAPGFNPGCPMPTNVAGYEEADRYAGYTRPAQVSATCSQFTPQPGPSPSVPETFRPLW